MNLALIILGALVASASAVPVEVSHRGLSDDFHDFMVLIPFDQIKELFYEYLEDDAQFQKAVDYLMSDEFISLLQEVENMPEIKKFMDNLEKRGVPVYEFVNKFNNFLGAANIASKRSSISKVEPPGVAGFLKRLRELIPCKELKALYQKKLETSPEFRDFIDYLKSEKTQQFVKKLMMNPKVQKFFSVAEENGVNVKEIINYITSFLGVKFPSKSRDLSQFYEKYGALWIDIQDFLKLLPRQKFEEIFQTYWKNDEEFRRALSYFDHPEFAKYVLDVERTPEFRDVLDLLEDANFPAYGIVEFFNALLKLPEVKPIIMKSYANQDDIGGFPGFMRALRQALPVDQIRAMYEKKIQTSEEFRNFIAKVESPEAKEVFQKFMKTEQMQTFLTETRKHGLDFKELHNFLMSSFGLFKYVSA